MVTLRQLRSEQDLSPLQRKDVRFLNKYTDQGKGKTKRRKRFVIYFSLLLWGGAIFTAAEGDYFFLIALAIAYLGIGISLFIKPYLPPKRWAEVLFLIFTFLAILFLAYITICLIHVFIPL